MHTWHPQWKLATKWLCNLCLIKEKLKWSWHPCSGKRKNGCATPPISGKMAALVFSRYINGAIVIVIVITTYHAVYWSYRASRADR